MAKYRKSRLELPVFPPQDIIFDYNELLNAHERKILFRSACGLRQGVFGDILKKNTANYDTCRYTREVGCKSCFKSIAAVFCPGASEINGERIKGRFGRTA